MASPDALLSVDEAAEFLGIGSRTVYKLVEAGELPRVKFGTRTLFAPADLRALIARHREGGPETADADAGFLRPSDGALRAMHAKASELDRMDGERPLTWKKAILRRASEQFGRAITSANDLTASEMDWAIDTLAEELSSRR